MFQDGNIIEYNHIHHMMNYQLDDGGGIYTLGWQPGVRICYNWIHDVYHDPLGHGAKGIYPDQGSAGIVFAVGQDAPRTFSLNVHISGTPPQSVSDLTFVDRGFRESSHIYILSTGPPGGTLLLDDVTVETIDDTVSSNAHP